MVYVTSHPTGDPSSEEEKVNKLKNWNTTEAEHYLQLKDKWTYLAGYPLNQEEKQKNPNLTNCSATQKKRKILNLLNEPIHAYYFVFTFTKMEYIEAYLWLSFWNWKQNNSGAMSLSDAPLQVLDTNSNKVLFQFWISYVVSYKSINLETDT